MAYCKTLLGIGFSFSLLGTVWSQAPSAASAASAAAASPQEAISAAAAAAPSAGSDKSSPIANKLSSVYAQAQSWRYKVTGYYLGPLSASAEMRFTPINSLAYQANLAVTIAGKDAMTMTSKGAIAGTNLIPQSFHEQVMGKAYQVKTEDGNIVFRGDIRYPLPKLGVQDSISQYYQLQQQLLSGALPSTAGASTVVWLVRPEGLFVWNYEVSDTKAIYHPILGKLDAVHIVPRSLGKGTTKSEMWFAPKLGYAPVRIKMELNDKSWMEMNWLP